MEEFVKSSNLFLTQVRFRGLGIAMVKLFLIKGTRTLFVTISQSAENWWWVRIKKIIIRLMGEVWANYGEQSQICLRQDVLDWPSWCFKWNNRHGRCWENVSSSGRIRNHLNWGLLVWHEEEFSCIILNLCYAPHEKTRRLVSPSVRGWRIMGSS